jgi:hypothetical protein
MDGAMPAAGLVRDKAGNFYGVTEFGGGLGSCPIEDTNYFCGTAFKLSRGKSGRWSEQVIFRFDEGKLGGYPKNTLTLDGKGNIYGVAEGGGGCSNGGCGIVFKLAPSGSKWSEKILYIFGGADGNDPGSPVIFDGGGNLYGTTIGGGTYDEGVAFVLHPAKKGQWSETVLRSFAPDDDGDSPQGLIVFDKDGNLYGTTSAGGKYRCDHYEGCGTAYELAHDTWDFSVIKYFRSVGSEIQGLAFDGKGNLYGTLDGFAQTYSAIFELIPTGHGEWDERFIYKFLGGKNVEAGMVTPDDSGGYYGASALGGDYGQGSVFQITQ